jgi:hypothetical protein
VTGVGTWRARKDSLRQVLGHHEIFEKQPHAKSYFKWRFGFSGSKIGETYDN